MALADELLEVFDAQSRELLTEMEAMLLALEEHPDDREALHAVFRVCHTFKGDARSLELVELGDLAHALEDLLDALRGEQIAVSPEIVSLLLSAVDVLRELSAAAVSGREVSSNRKNRLLETVRAVLNADDPAVVLSQRTQAGIESTARDASLAHAGRATLRVRLETLDRLLDMVGELATGRERLSQGFARGDLSLPTSLLETHLAMEKTFSELQNEVLRLRLVPVGPLLREQLRTMRDAAMVEGKKACMGIEGEDAELDTAVLAQLREPLGHLVRNAIAHGIERPDERESAGKDPSGKIVLRARREGASVIIEVADDGAGLDRDRIRERAVQMGLAVDAGQLSDADLPALILEPGFSTVENSSATAGRGVGLDVVRSRIESLGGSVGVESESGRGTCWRLRLPLTLAIIDGFAIVVGDEVYLLPIDSVTECLDHASVVRQDAGLSGVIHLRGSALPYLRLRELLKIPGQSSGRESVVVIKNEGHRIGLAVDSVLGDRQAVIKPLGRYLRDLPEISGSTVLGNGRVALVLDPGALIARAEELPGTEGFAAGAMNEIRAASNEAGVEGW
jgi:two-component system chemotaxis sensor kinase CheA